MKTASKMLKGFLWVGALVLALTMGLAWTLIVSPHASHAAFPGANGANGKIAFSSSRDSNPDFNKEIYVMNSDGSGQNRLTTNTAIETEASWAPDGTKIAFASSRDANDPTLDGHYEIYLMNADGSGQTRLTNHPEDDRQPAWSPSGAKIAFRSNRDGGNFDVYVMNADGTGVTRLTTNTAIDQEPSWSPDSTKMIFMSTRDGHDEIYVMNADGSNQTRLTNSTDPKGEPAWSPDGTRIAFRSNRTGGREIFVMNADGSNPMNLTNNPGDDYYPAWSPDGTKIAFFSDRIAGNRDIYVMNADGSNQTRLTTGPGLNEEPDWGAVVGPPSPPRVITVDIDIKPGSFPNSINPKSQGTIPVAILSTAIFNAATQVDKTSLTFGRTGSENSLSKCTGDEDVNGDGMLDVVCRFTTQQTGFQSGDTVGVLEGKTNGGIPIVGTDSVKIVPN